MELTDYLREEASEAIPAWLLKYSKWIYFPRKNFFASRIVYYPGSATDGQPLRTFGKSHACHCFVYVDNTYSKTRLLQILNDENDAEHPRGYRALSVIDVKEEELTPGGWIPHQKVPPKDRINDSFLHSMPPEGPFVIFAVLERINQYGEEHGPRRMAILHVGGDAYATFDALFCQRNSQLPYAVLLQNHSYGGNWNYDGFGDNSMLHNLAKQSNKQMPKWLLVGDNTKPWSDYVETGFCDIGGMHGQVRRLFSRY